MSFRILRHSTTADASDSNDNNYWIGQGSVLPMSGSLLLNTTGTHDLGSSSYKWDNAYFESIPSLTLDSGNNTWEHITRSIVNIDTSRINITGLDTQDTLFVMTYLFKTATSTAATVTMYINQFSTTANYTRMWAQSSITAASNFTTARTPMILANNAGTTSTSLWTLGYFQFRYYILSDASLSDGVNVAMTGGESHVDYNVFSTHQIGMTNTAGTLTSIQIIPETGNILAGSFFDLWSMPETRLD